MNRMTNCEKWKDRWFRDLSPYGKLVFIFLYENCDNAGIYEIDEKMIGFLTGLNMEEYGLAIKELGKSHVKSKDAQRIWIKNFLKYQNKLPLNRKNNAHKQIILILEQNLEDKDKFKGNKEMEEIIPIDPNKPKEKKKAAPVKRMVKPTVEEVKEYMIKEQFKGNPDSESKRFINHYESNGWKVGGKSPMKVWKGSVANWMSNWYDRNETVTKPNTGKLGKIQEAHDALKDVDWEEVYKEENEG
jgi:hypothetical protein